jgi:hypothetical protein
MKTWLWVIGSFYVLLGVRFLPAINSKQVRSVLPDWTASPESVEFKALVDWQWCFGLDLLAIGLVAVVGAAVGRSVGLPYIIWVVIARELIGGIVPDAWLIMRGYTNRRLYSAFIVVHAAIIATGLAVIQ